MPAKPAPPVPSASRSSSRPNRTLTLWSTPRQRAMVTRLRKRHPDRSFSSIVWALVEALDTKAIQLSATQVIRTPVPSTPARGLDSA